MAAGCISRHREERGKYKPYQTRKVYLGLVRRHSEALRVCRVYGKLLRGIRAPGGGCTSRLGACILLLGSPHWCLTALPTVFRAPGPSHRLLRARPTARSARKHAARALPTSSQKGYETRNQGSDHYCLMAVGAAAGLFCTVESKASKQGAYGFARAQAGMHIIRHSVFLATAASDSD